MRLKKSISIRFATQRFILSSPELVEARRYCLKGSLGEGGEVNRIIFVKKYADKQGSSHII